MRASGVDAHPAQTPTLPAETSTASASANNRLLTVNTVLRMQDEGDRVKSHVFETQPPVQPRVHAESMMEEVVQFAGPSRHSPLCGGSILSAPCAHSFAIRQSGISNRGVHTAPGRYAVYRPDGTGCASRMQSFFPTLKISRLTLECTPGAILCMCRAAARVMVTSRVRAGVLGADLPGSPSIGRRSKRSSLKTRSHGWNRHTIAFVRTPAATSSTSATLDRTSAPLTFASPCGRSCRLAVEPCVTALASPRHLSTRKSS